MQTRTLLVFWVLGIASYLGFGGLVQAQSPSYQGKTIKLIQGCEPGGSGDIRSPFLSKYIPGNPNIVTEAMIPA